MSDQVPSSQKINYLRIISFLKRLSPFILGPDIFEDFRDHIPNLRLDPLKLIFNVWHKAFKEGRYSKNKKIEKVLFEFKEKTKETDKEYLFSSLNKLEFESLRKSSLYRLKNLFTYM